MFKCVMCELNYLNDDDRAVLLTDQDGVVCVECVDFVEERLGQWDSGTQ